MMIKKRLTNKLILVYFLVVILPICAVYFVFVILLFSRTLQSESEKYQYEIDMAVNDLETELKNLENIADAILKNGYITEFLRYQYDTDWEPMYDYVSNVQYQLHSGQWTGPRPNGLLWWSRWQQWGYPGSDTASDIYTAQNP